MNRIALAVILVIAVGVGYIGGFMDRTSGAEVGYCNDGQSLCILIDVILPETYKENIQNFQGLEVYQEFPENWTYMEFDVASLPASIEPELVLTYMENIESNIKMTKAMTTLVPLIYTNLEPAPLCMWDKTGVPAGYYSNNGQLQVILDDANCFGNCDPDGGPCVPPQQGSQAPIYGPIQQF